MLGSIKVILIAIIFHKTWGIVFCYKCADSFVLEFADRIPEVSELSSSNSSSTKSTKNWTSCYTPENISCTTCLEIRFSLTVGVKGYVRSCASEQIVAQSNESNFLLSRQDSIAKFEGRICSTTKCNRYFGDEDKPAKALRSFFTRHASPIAITVLVLLCLIPTGILGGREIHKFMRKDEPQSESPVEERLIATRV